MEEMVDGTFWKGKRVLVTGHTGFKGAWLCVCLKRIGARPAGFSLDPPSTPNLFDIARLSDDVPSTRGDVCDLDLVARAVGEYRPEIVIHMAAQSLVRRSYRDPIGTLAANVMGTAHLLEAVRRVGGVKAVIVVTSDKCYENREWMWAYREVDRMGGLDPYSCSKGCAELVTAAYRRSFLEPPTDGGQGTAVASVRAGNIVGGGDWGEDRLVPDIVRAFSEDKTLLIRSPNAVRPWQHVLDALYGYLMLAERLYGSGDEYAQAWNFGPSHEHVVPVRYIVERMTSLWGEGGRVEIDTGPHPREATHLALDSTKARRLLGWKPRLNIDATLEWTVSWYKRYHQDPSSMRSFTEMQIDHYLSIGG
jgi:CDP-glucose 4,6-dehydratase